jgi:hypothetical protein
MEFRAVFLKSRADSSLLINTGQPGRGYLAAGDGAEDDERLAGSDDWLRKRFVGRIVREVFLAGEVADEGAALQAVVIADGAAEHGVAGFERVEDCGDGDRSRDLKRNFRADTGEITQVRGQHDADCRSFGHDG